MSQFTEICIGITRFSSVQTPIKNHVKNSICEKKPIFLLDISKIIPESHTSNKCSLYVIQVNEIHPGIA